MSNKSMDNAMNAIRQAPEKAKREASIKTAKHDVPGAVLSPGNLPANKSEDAKFRKAAQAAIRRKVQALPKSKQDVASRKQLMRDVIAKRRQALPGRDVTRQESVDAIKTLLDHSQQQLLRIARCVKLGRWDKAGLLCCIVANNRAKIQHEMELLDRAKLTPLPEERKPTVKPRRSKAKVKTYKTWSEK